MCTKDDSDSVLKHYEILFASKHPLRIKKKRRPASVPGICTLTVNLPTCLLSSKGTTTTFRFYFQKAVYRDILSMLLSRVRAIITNGLTSLVNMNLLPGKCALDRFSSYLPGEKWMKLRS